ncbi:MAG: collagen-like protein, partial [bacterium]|nr:collagen-like protein [bacterium]
DFGIPRGYTGPRGPSGSNGSDGKDGKNGKDGSNGRDGSDGLPGIDGTISGGIAGAASGAVSGASAGSAAATTIVNAHLAVIQPQITSLQTSVSGLQTQVDTLGQGLTQIDNDIVALKSKTQYTSAGVGITTINSTLNTNDINANTIYVANDLIVVDEVKASKFSGGLLSTQIAGSNINIGTNESLINTINIGSSSTITTINGFVNYSNPFNNFFAQW